MTSVCTHRRRPARLRPFRSAFTLIEVAIVVTITSLLFALSATTIVVLLRVERQCAADAASAQALSRLVARWRADVHAAVAATCNGNCVLTCDDGRTIHYQLESPAVVHEVRRSDAVEHRDSFVFARNFEANFSSEAAERREIAIMKVESRAHHSGQAAQVGPVEVIAVVNLHGSAVDGRLTP